ncbi:unnamed protein product, partial [Effrenium voratum]
PMCAAQVVLQALLLALVAAEEDSICETGMVLLQLTQNRLLKPAARLVQTATGTLSQPPPASGPVGLCTSPSPRIARAVAGGLLRRWQQCRHAERKT